MSIQNFNLRVYGLIIHENRILITHEHRAGIVMTKFPGGGLEKGEGLADGLKRELNEEMNLEADVRGIFYVNEFLQISTFNKNEQLISFYYYVFPKKIETIQTGGRLSELKPGEQIFEWVTFDQLHPDDFTFPIDRAVVERLVASRRT